MHRDTQNVRRRRRVASVVAATLALSGPVAACAGTQEPTGTSDWIAANASAVTVTSPEGPLDDLAPLRNAIGNAEIVGLGESVHGAAEELTLKHRALQVLVEQLGFRSVAWEEDWTTGRRINDYLLTGAGDPDELVRRMSSQWQSREVVEVLRWLHDFNRDRTDKVQFMGVEYYLTGLESYDDVEAQVAAAAPEQLPEARQHLQAIRPASADIIAHIQAYSASPDKEPFLRHARALYNLVRDLPNKENDRDHAMAVHTARQILSFYEHFALPEADSHAYRDAHAAENLMWWRQLTGDKIAYWAASPHTANAPQLRISASEDGEIQFPSAGSHLRQEYGERYLSIGFMFDHGRVGFGGGEPVDAPKPAEGWFEQPLGQVPLEQFVLDLRAPAPSSVREWLDAPIVTRGPMGPNSTCQGGSASQWFDVVVHGQEVTPASAA
ncbi:erythromycin esterase family protein [Pseudonocardia adelaidensis]|uniref:Erythromycin esterase n=1 Tax=Pseudonocardia adelaidensis TaxID=648754 RepID=A0ABP9NNU9_9PSEU